LEEGGSRRNLKQKGREKREMNPKEPIALTAFGYIKTGEKMVGLAVDELV